MRPVHLIGRAWLDLEITGREHLPATGPMVFAANHYSHIDPPLVSLAAGENVRYLAVDELFGQYRAFDAFTLFFGAIPMSRVKAPLGALKTALAHLESGGLVGVFPEGRRVAYWGESVPKQGAAWLALRTGAPLVPVAICGTEGTLSLPEPGVRRTAVRVWVEAPLLPAAYVDRQDPRGEMIGDWRLALERRLGPWTDGADRTGR
jgi:1-acyl-sn-glycerol-3-phosphate acyltransferase